MKHLSLTAIMILSIAAAPAMAFGDLSGVTSQPKVPTPASEVVTKDTASIKAQ